MKALSALCVAIFCAVFLSCPCSAAGKYQNFSASVYARVFEVRQRGDLNWLETRWNEISRRVKIDKIYLETHRDLIVAGGSKCLVCPMQIKPHSYRVFAAVK